VILHEGERIVKAREIGGVIALHVLDHATPARRLPGALFADKA